MITIPLDNTNLKPFYIQIYARGIDRCDRMEILI